MPHVMINCPKTKEPIFTGISLEREAFETEDVPANAVRCPHCGELHEWTKVDAFLDETTPEA